MPQRGSQRSASAYYTNGGRSQFVALRLAADGVPDPGFGDGDVASFDRAAEGVFGDAAALTLQAGQPVIAGTAVLFEDVPQAGSAPNLPTSGRTFIGGPNVTIGPLANPRLTPDAPATGAGLDLAHYGNGPWGAIEVRLEACRTDALVGSASLTTDGSQPGRDNTAMRMPTLDGVGFDALRIGHRLDGCYTAERILLDDLPLTRAPLR